MHGQSMKIGILFVLLFMSQCQEELQQEEAIQIMRDLKDATTKRLELLENVWKKYSTKKSEQICAFSEMTNEQESQCQTRNAQNLSVQDAINQSISIVQTTQEKIQKNKNRNKNLSDLKCKLSLNNIKFLKDQKEAKNLSIQLQKSIAQSSSKNLIDLLSENSIYEISEQIITEDEQRVITLIQQSQEDEEKNHFIEVQNEIQHSSLLEQDNLPYSSQKAMEKNKNQILTTSQDLAKSIDENQDKLTINSINSVTKIEQMSSQLITENNVLQKLIELEQERKIDLDDQYTILQGENSECDNSRRKMEILTLLLQQDYDREQILYMKEKEAILKELDIYTDLLRYYLRQIYKQDS